MVNEIVAGMTAPDFTLPDHEGKPFTLANTRGHPLVLFFYSENDTPVCTTHACNMQVVHQQLAARGVRVVGISHDTVASHQAFRTKHHLDYTLLADPGKQVFELYNAWGEKNSYGRLIQGLLRSSFVIDAEGRVVKVFRRLNTKVNAGQILQTFETLGLG